MYNLHIILEQKMEDKTDGIRNRFPTQAQQRL